jgi:tRNA pseudouridine13 synthase
MEPELVRELSQTTLPLPSARSPLPQGRLGEIVVEVLQDFGLAWADLRIKHLKDIFLSKGTRPCLFFPQDLEFSAVADELHPDRRGLRLSFALAKGSYATILVKRLTDTAAQLR